MFYIINMTSFKFQVYYSIFYREKHFTTVAIYFIDTILKLSVVIVDFFSNRFIIVFERIDTENKKHGQSGMK